MAIQMITISVPDQVVAKLRDIAEEQGAVGIRTFPESQASERTTLTMLAGPDVRQELVDQVQAALSSREDWRLTIHPVETTVPLPRDEEERQSRRKEGLGGATREEIWHEVWDHARLDQTYIVWVVLATVVAAFGMVTDNVAVVVGGMVIAPLLGPNLAFAVGVALGDRTMISRALITNLTGLAVVLGISILIGLFWTNGLEARELLSRAEVSFASVAIALASGAAAALSLVTGISSALVGVMVAVALLPPTSAVGIFIGSDQFDLAANAAMLLAVNVVSVNLAAHSVLFWRGVRPRTFFEDRKGRLGRIVSAATWIVLLTVLVVLMWWRG